MATIYIAQSIGGTVDWIAPLRADGSQTVVIKDQAGGTQVSSAAATLDAVNTTLVEGVERGSKELVLTSAADVVVNRRYLISSTGDQSEFVEIRALNGTSATLKYPLFYDHPAAAAFQGTRQSVVITAGQADHYDQVWRAEFTWADAATSTNQPIGVVDFVVTQHALYNPVSAVDLLARFPLIQRRLDEDTDINAFLAQAFDDTLMNLWAQGTKPSAIIGMVKLYNPVLYRAAYLLSEQYGQSHQDERKELWDAAQHALDVFKASATLDPDQDGAAEPWEQGGGGGYWERG